MTSPFSCSAASSGLLRLFHMSKPSSKWGPSSPGQELLCVSRRKFANLDLLRIRHFEKFDFRSDTHGMILGKYQTSNRAISSVDFLYQPSQELSRVIRLLIAADVPSENAGRKRSKEKPARTEPMTMKNKQTAASYRCVLPPSVNHALGAHSLQFWGVTVFRTVSL